MAFLAVTISGDEETIIRLNGMAARMNNVAPVLEWAKKSLTATFRSNFASNGLLVGGWSPLEPEYFAWKAVRFPGAPTLVRTGQLFRSIGAQNASSSASKDEVVVGTNLKYAKFHQYGTSKMPKRQIIFEPRGFTNQFARIVSNWVANGVV